MTFAVMSFIINQHLYNALLFRKTFEGFMWSFLVGNLCSSEMISAHSPRPHDSVVVPAPVKVAPVQIDVAEESNLTFNLSKESEATDIQSETSFDAAVGAAKSCESGSLFEGVDSAHARPRARARLFALRPGRRAKQPKNSSGTTGTGNIGTNVIQSMATSIHDREDESERSSDYLLDAVSYEESTGIVSELTPDQQDDDDVSTIEGDVLSVLPRLNGETTSLATIVTGSDADELSVLQASTQSEATPSTINQNDVYIQTGGDVYTELETQTGTLAWKNAIQEATQKFAGSTFVDAHNDWILKQLGNRDFYVGSVEYGWTKLNPVQVREKCKESYEKQVQVNGEIKSILNGLKDLRRNKEKGRRPPPQDKKHDDSPIIPTSNCILDGDMNPEPVNSSPPPEEKKGRRGILARITRHKSNEPLLTTGYKHEGGTLDKRDDNQATNDPAVVSRITKTPVKDSAIDGAGVVSPRLSKSKPRKKMPDEQMDSSEKEVDKRRTKESREPEMDEPIKIDDLKDEDGRYDIQVIASTISSDALGYISDVGELLSECNKDDKKTARTPRNEPATSSDDVQVDAREPVVPYEEFRVTKTESREALREKTALAKPTAKKRGFKNLFSRSKDQKTEEKHQIKPLEGDAKNDPEKVKKWIGDQAKAKRFQSKFFGSVWKRALLLRKGKQAENPEDILDDEYCIQEVFSEEDNKIEMEPPIFKVTETSTKPEATPAAKSPKKSQLRTVSFDTRTIDSENDKADNNVDTDTVSDSSFTDTDSENDGTTTFFEKNGMSFYDQLMFVLALDFEKAMSNFTDADDGSISNISTVSSIHSSGVSAKIPPPQTLLEFVERKIEEEELACPNFCTGGASPSNPKRGRRNDSDMVPWPSQTIAFETCNWNSCTTTCPNDIAYDPQSMRSMEDSETYFTAEPDSTCS